MATDWFSDFRFLQTIFVTKVKRSGVLNNVEPETQSKRIKLVPGVFEIPVVIKKYIDSFDAFIALGCVIKGKTPHFDFISRASINEIMNLSTRYGKPIGNGIITCLNKKQALERSDREKKIEEQKQLGLP